MYVGVEKVRVRRGRESQTEVSPVMNAALILTTLVMLIALITPGEWHPAYALTHLDARRDIHIATVQR
jgi:hypothetical protein